MKIIRKNRCRLVISILTIATAISAHATERTWQGSVSSEWTAANWAGGANTSTSSGAFFYLSPGAQNFSNITVIAANANTEYISYGPNADSNIKITVGDGTNQNRVIRLSSSVGGAPYFDGAIVVAADASGTFEIAANGPNANLTLGTNTDTGTLNYLFTNSSVNAFTISAPMVASGTITATVTRNLNFGGAGDWNVSGAITNAFSSAQTDNLNKSGADTLTLSATANSYNGATTVTGGVVSVTKLAAGGTTSSIGTSSNSAANLVLNGGTLRYTGTGDSTDRQFTVGTGASAAALEANGTGAMSFTSTAAVAFTGSGARTLTLTGTNAGSNTLALTIGDDPSGATSLLKSGAGKWVVSGSNSFTGGTTISTGTLTVGNANALGASTSAVTANGGALDLGGFSITTGTATFAGGTVSNGTLTSSAYSGQSGSVSAALSGSGALTKSTTGTLTLSGNNNFTGATTVNAGTLLINGSHSSAVTVNSSAVLGGSGTISAAVTIVSGGTISPGNSPGILSTGTLTLAGSELAQLGKAGARSGSQPLAGTDYDQINVTGAVTLTGGDLTLSILTGIQAGDLYYIIKNDGIDPVTGVFATLNGSIANLTQGQQFSSAGQFFQISYTADSTGGTFTGGNDVALMAVPEPSAWALVGVAGMMLIFRRRRHS